MNEPIKLLPYDHPREQKNALNMKNEEELKADVSLQGQINYWMAKTDHYKKIIDKASLAIEVMNKRILRMQTSDPEDFSGKNALIVGRTKQDLYECYEVGSDSLHLPSPSTLMFDDYGNFDGDVISLHTPKDYSDYIISMELDERESQYIEKGDERFIIGIDGYSQLFGGYNGELPNSGIFAIYWCLEQGYKNVYTVGLDLINYWVSTKDGSHSHFGRQENPHEIDWDALQAAVLDFPPKSGGYIKGIGRTPTHFQQALTIAKIAYRYPNQRIFKATDISILPCEVRIPPGITKL